MGIFFNRKMAVAIIRLSKLRHPTQISDSSGRLKELTSVIEKLLMVLRELIGSWSGK
jgi:hypothetical protein